MITPTGTGTHSPDVETGMKHRRTTFRVALSMTALIALMGCSDDLPGTAGGAEKAPTVIRISGAGGSGGAKMSETAALGAPEAMSSDAAPTSRMMMPCFGLTEYVLVGELPALDTPVDGWRYAPSTQLDEEAVARIAAAFGVGGDIVELPPDWGGGWRIGPDDGSAPALWFGADGLGWWSYSAPWNTTAEANAVASDQAVAPSGEGEGAMVDPSIKPMELQPPVGVPDAARATELARQVFEQLGLEVGETDLEVYADQWGASVTLWHTLDGMRTGYATGLGFGADAAITYAGGQSREPERVTGFERVGTSAGFDRLVDSGGMWWGGGYARPKVSCAPPLVMDDSVTVEPGLTPEGAPEPATEPASEPQFVEPPTITVEIVSVKEAWWTLYDMDGTVWLVPGYVFVDREGGEHMVPAVSDDLVQPVEPTSVDEPVVSEPTPVVSEPLPVEPGTSEPVDVADPAAATATAEEIIGLTEDKAAAVVEGAGLAWRVVERDGEQFPVTADYRTDRVNAVIADGVVTSAKVG